MGNPYDTASERMSVLGPTLRFKGELSAEEDLLIEGSVEFGRVARERDEDFRPAVAVPVIVVLHAAPHGSISGLLIGLADGGDDRQAFGVGRLAVGVDDDLARHLGDELGMRRLGFA